MPLHPNYDFRSILLKRLELRRQTNPTYSIRAFARQLKVSHTFLSSVLSRKKRLSIELAEQFCERMRFDETEECRFLTLVILETVSSPPLKHRLHRCLNSGTSTPPSGNDSR